MGPRAKLGPGAGAENLQGSCSHDRLDVEASAAGFSSGFAPPQGIPFDLRGAFRKFPLRYWLFY